MSRTSPSRCKPVPEEVRQTADLLERRWQLSIIYAALTGALRFNEFADAVAGISPRMLVRAPARPRGRRTGRAHGDPLQPADRRVPADRPRPPARARSSTRCAPTRASPSAEARGAAARSPAASAGQLRCQSMSELPDQLTAGTVLGVDHLALGVANPHDSHHAAERHQRGGDHHAPGGSCAARRLRRRSSAPAPAPAAGRARPGARAAAAWLRHGRTRRSPERRARQAISSEEPNEPAIAAPTAACPAAPPRARSRC